MRRRSIRIYTHYSLVSPWNIIILWWIQLAHLLLLRICSSARLRFSHVALNFLFATGFKRYLIWAHQCSMYSIWPHGLSSQACMHRILMLYGNRSSSTTSDAWVFTSYFVVHVLASINGMMISCSLYRLLVVIILYWRSSLWHKEIRLSHIEIIVIGWSNASSIWIVYILAEFLIA